jgi:hypothetical protein
VRAEARRVKAAGAGSGRPRTATRSQGWRKIAAATWGQPVDPQIYGDFDVDAERLLAFIEETRSATGVHVTVTHVVGKAVAHALAEHPSLNTRLVRGKFVPRDSVDVFFVVAVEGGRDLSGVKVVGADRKSVAEIAEELAGRAVMARSGEDAEFGKAKKVLAVTPRPLVRIGLRLHAWLTSDHDAEIRRLGITRQPFGSGMVTSVGMFGVQRAFGPLSPFYRLPFLALVSEVAERAVVVGGRVVARPMLTISATIDHRYYDGSHAAKLARSVRAYLENPYAFEPAPAGEREPAGDRR